MPLIMQFSEGVLQGIICFQCFSVISFLLWQSFHLLHLYNT